MSTGAGLYTISFCFFAEGYGGSILINTVSI